MVRLPVRPVGTFVPMKRRDAVAQVYFLSVLANVVAGLVLAGDYLGERIALFAPFKNLRANRTAVIVVAAVALAVGVTKLIVLSPGESVPVAGDLLPALTGMALGAFLFADIFRPQLAGQGQSSERVAEAVLSYRVPVGIAGVIVAVVQFLVPGVLIL